MELGLHKYSLIIILLVLISMNFISAEVKLGTFIGKPIGGGGTVIVNGTINQSNFWDNYDTPSQIPHNILALIQGGTTGEYYHATLAQTYFWYNQSSPFYTWLNGFNYNYNQSDGSYNKTYQDYAYNQTYSGSIFNSSYAQCIPYAYNQTYSGSTYNSTYNLWAYNQSDGIGTGNLTWNQSLANILYAGIQWGYNQTYNGNTYNSTYNIYAYNQSFPFYTWLSSFAYNYNETQYIIDTYGKYFYNMSDGNNGNTANGTTLSINNITNFNYNYNQTYSGSTFNSTYDKYAYNMSDGNTGNTPNGTTLTIGNITNFNYNYNQTYSGSTFNSSYDKYAYNQSDGSYNISYDTWLGNYTTSSKYWYNMSDGIGSSNSTFNQTLTNTLYAPIGTVGSNESFNQTFTDTLYSSIIWGYNQTYSGSIFNSSYAQCIPYAYNQTYSGSTYNSTYDKYAYNQSITPSLVDNSTKLDITNVTNFFYNYNQTDWLITNFGMWWYNMTTSSSMLENGTKLYVGNITGFNYNYNQTYSGSTFNSTYNTYAYNQTYSGSTFNSTYNTWQNNYSTSSKYWYNMTTGGGVQDYTNIAMKNQSNNFTQQQTFNAQINTSSNIYLGSNMICGDAGCTKYILYNATGWYIQS